MKKKILLPFSILKNRTIYKLVQQFSQGGIDGLGNKTKGHHQALLNEEQNRIYDTLKHLKNAVVDYFDLIDCQLLTKLCACSYNIILQCGICIILFKKEL